jgi:hypothetical protein
MPYEIFNPVFNLERDVKRTWWMVDHIRHDQVYAQNLYAAMCNNTFGPYDVWAILKNVTWDCTWRYAANIVAEIREDHFEDWYCSGVQLLNPDFVPESVIVPTIENDLEKLGWIVVDRNVKNLL